MSRSPVDAAAGRALEAMVNSSLVRYGALPVPRDAPLVHATGSNPDRILLIGTGAVRGMGLTSNELGLGGQLARRLTPRTGRGVDVELGSTTTLMMAQATSILEPYDTSRFDAIILLVGMRDAIHLTALKDWIRDMRRLLQVASRVPRVFVVGIPDFVTYLDLPRLAARMIRRRTERLNDATRSVVLEMPGVEFVPFSPVHPHHFVAPGSVEIYETWADALAPVIAAGLDSGIHSTRPADHVDREARQHALDALGIVDGAIDLQVRRIARTARDLLEAAGAAVTFLDGDRLWTVSAISTSGVDISRSDSFCGYTVARPEVFVVEDASKDERFATHPDVALHGVKFYAGFPIEARDGVRVGALCVVDTKPRQFSSSEATLLRELALQVQTELWESSVRPPSPVSQTLGR
ncbi:MAG: GAF domain-containing protein [Pseudolysinimonas sp.]